MAKAQAKKAAGAKKSAKKKPAAKPKAAAKKAAAKKAPVKKTAAKKKAPAKKPVPAKKKPAKKPTVAKKAVAPKKTPTKKAPAKKAPAPVAKVVAAAKSVAKTVVKAVVAAAPPIVAKAAKVIAKAPEKRARRPRTRVQSTGVATANWFSKENEKPRPSSFIPAPPRAEAPSLVAAPPATSDRLIRPEDLNEQAVRTVPVRIDIEQSAGRVYLLVSPNEVNLKPGEGIEWDFRYLGGADVMVEELQLEFDKPSPFSTTNFKSRKPGAARPHRQLSGAATKSAAGKSAEYTVRAINQFKTVLATTRLTLNVV